MSFYDRLHGFNKAVKDSAREFNRYQIMRDAQQKNAKFISPYDKNIWDAGIEWFNSGLSLEDADEKLKSNTNFINGFSFAKRQNIIKEHLLKQGEDWFFNGNKLENAPERVINNEFFIKGYNDAKNSTKCRRK